MSSRHDMRETSFPDRDGEGATASEVDDDGAQTPEELAAEWEAAKPPAAGPLSNVAAAVVVIGLAVAGILGSISLGLGTVKSPEAGTWPFLISCALLALGAALALSVRNTHDTEQFSVASWGVLAGLGTMIVFALMVGTIGFEIPALLLAFIWLRFLGHETWRSSVVGSVLMVVAFYLVFVVALSVSIPHLI